MKQAKAIFIGLVLIVVVVLLAYLGTAFVAVAVSLVLVPLLVLALSYGCWRETRARVRELIFFVLVTSFLGLFPIYVKSFIALQREGGPLFSLVEIAGGLMGFGFFLFTLADAIGHPVRPIAGEGLRALPSYKLLQDLKALAKRAGVKVQDIFTLPAEMLAPKFSLATGLTTKNLYLADFLVEAMTPEELKCAVARELWHFKRRDLWINFLVYCGWLLLVSLYPVLSWVVIALFGGVLFTFLLPLIGRLKELAADRYGRTLVGSPRGFLTYLQKEAGLLPDKQARGLRAYLESLLSSWPPLSLRILRAWRELRRQTIPTIVANTLPDVRAHIREAWRFLAWQYLVFVALLVMLLLPGILWVTEVITERWMKVLYGLAAVGLYGSFIARVWWRIYWTLRAQHVRDRGRARRRGPWWSYVLPLLLVGASGWVTVSYHDRVHFTLLIAALIVSLGIIFAALLSSEVRKHTETKAPPELPKASRDKETEVSAPD